MNLKINHPIAKKLEELAGVYGMEFKPIPDGTLPPHIVGYIVPPPDPKTGFIDLKKVIKIIK